MHQPTPRSLYSRLTAIARPLALAALCVGILALPFRATAADQADPAVGLNPDFARGIEECLIPAAANYGLNLNIISGFRTYAELPILADALQDAGCDDDRILGHLRTGTKGHCSKCWVIAKLLA